MKKATTGVLASSGADYVLEGSVRMVPEAQGHFKRVLTETGSQTTMTFSGWVKRTRIRGSRDFVFLATSAAGSDANSFSVVFDATDRLVLTVAGQYVTSNAVYRDTSSWYHIVAVMDTTQALNYQRSRLYVNGQRVNSLATAQYPNQNTGGVNLQDHIQIIGDSFLQSRTPDGLFSDFYFIDGQALNPDQFGQVNSTTGLWEPKEYTGSLGTNGFHLPFDDGRNVLTLGKDALNTGEPNFNARVLGNASISTSQSKWGQGSVSFDGTGDYLRFHNSGNLLGDWYSSDYTLEYWVYGNAWGQSSNGGSNVMGLAQEAGAGEYWSFGPVSDGTVRFYYYDGGVNFIDSSSTVSTGTWNHLALVKDGTILRIFINGVQSYSATMGSIPVATEDSYFLLIGAGANVQFNGFLQDLRITKGVARYKSSFTPPTSQLPIGESDPYWENVALYIPGNGTNGSQTIPTYGTLKLHSYGMYAPTEVNSAFATRSGSAVFSTSTGKFNGSSLSIPNAQLDQVNFRTGSNADRNYIFNGDFTIESWVYPTGGADRSLYVLHDGSTYFAFNFDVTNSRFNLYFNSGSPTHQISHTFTVNQWAHFALVRSGMGSNNVKLYVNGSQIWQGTLTSYLGYRNPTLNRIGGGVSGASMFIDDFRIYNRYAKYTSNFTPATEQMPIGIEDEYWANVLLAISCNGSNNGAIFQGYYSGNYARGVPWEGDLFTDTPSNNHCTANSLSIFAGTLNLAGTRINAGNDCVTTVGVTSGKWYWESSPVAFGTGGNVAHWGIFAGFGNSLQSLISVSGIETDTFWFRNDSVVSSGLNGYIFSNVSSNLGTIQNVAVGDVLSFELDLDSNPKTFKVKLNNQSTPIFSYTFNYNRTMPVFPWFRNNTDNATWVNFGARPFVYGPSEGYKTICQENLPDPSIYEPDKHFDVALYTGNGVNGPNALQVTGYKFKPEFVWIKNRSSGTANHHLQDANRGTGLFLVSNSSSADQLTGGGDVSSFNNDGFTVSYANDRTNQLNNLYVAWMWNATDNSSPNSDGSISSTVRANQEAGISIVSYVGNGVDPSTVGHGLGVKPRFVMIKNRDQGNRLWNGYGPNARRSGAELFTNTTFDIGSRSGGTLGWNYDSGGSFNSGGGTYGMDPQTNFSGDDYIAYCFAQIEGFSAIGTYYGNGSTNGPFVYTGFKPAYVMIKSLGTAYTSGTSVAGGWNVFDYKRQGIGNDYNNVLYPNLAVADQGYRVIDLNSNGFKIRGTTTGAGAFNASNLFLYIAFADSPFKYSRGA